jgi:hypothetical protein
LGTVYILEYFGVFHMRESSSTAGAMEASIFLSASGSSSLHFYGFPADFWFTNPHSVCHRMTYPDQGVAALEASVNLCLNTLLRNYIMEIVL